MEEGNGASHLAEGKVSFIPPDKQQVSGPGAHLSPTSTLPYPPGATARACSPRLSVGAPHA